MTPLKELPSHAKPQSCKEESQVFCVECSIIRCDTLRILCRFATLREALGFFQRTHIMTPLKKANYYREGAKDAKKSQVKLGVLGGFHMVTFLHEETNRFR
jgi:hypothetical protein